MNLNGLTGWDELYLEIAKKIKDNISQIKWTDLWHNQVGYLENEHPFPTPAIFIAFRILNTEDLGEKVQNLQIQIDLYYFFETFSETYNGAYNQTDALEYLKTLTQIHKTFHTTNGTNYAEMNSHLVDEKGKIRNFQQFKRKVIATDTKYNKNHLQAEYQTAKRSAKMAIKWKDFEKNKRLFPNLKYMTTNDDKVRKDHAPLHGIIRAVNDPFWNIYYPPNGWRCRCYVKQTTEPVNDKQPKELPTKGFTHNAGKSNQIYNPKEHPYFNIPKKDSKDVKIAFENFKQLKTTENLKKPLKTELKCIYIHLQTQKTYSETIEQLLN